MSDVSMDPAGNNDDEPVADEITGEQPLYDPVSLEDFVTVDLDTLTADLRRLDRHALVDLFWGKVREAQDAGDAVAERVYRLVSSLAGLHLRVEAEGDPFGLQWQSKARRTALPHDFSGN